MALSGTSMAAAVESGTIAVVMQAVRSAGHRPLSPNALKAAMEYTAFSMRDASGKSYDRMTQGAGRLNGQGFLALARSIDASAPAGSYWLTTSVAPVSTYAGISVPWTQ